MTTAVPPDLATVNLSDHALWREHPPHEIFARLRAERPVHWSPLSQFPHEADQPVRAHSLFLNQHKSIPVSFTPSARRVAS